MTKIETREIEIRAAVNDAREVTGIGVPYGEIISVWGQREMFAPGSVQAEGAKLLYRHADPIGAVISATDDKTAWTPTAKISATTRGDEAYQLARDGVLDGLSVGFTPTKWHTERDDQGEYVVYDEAIVREVSLVPFPAYPSARVTNVRHDQTDDRKEHPTMTDDQKRAEQERADDVRELRESVEDVKRTLTVLRSRSDRDETPAPDTRSAGQVLKAIVSGDEETIRAYNEMQERAYEGGTIADAIAKDAWVGDLTRLFDSASGVLVDTFSSGTLPDSGENVEFGELDANSITVDEVDEGDDIPMGNVKVKTRTAPVKTYAGGTELTRKEIERASVNVLNVHMDALSIAAGARKKAVMRAAYDALVAARIAVADNAGVVALGKTLAAGTADDWENILIDAAIKFEGMSLTLDRLLVSGNVFKKLRSLTVAGERVFQVAKDNSSGVLDLPGLSGDFAGLNVRLDTGKTSDGAEFVNKRALRAYDSPLVSLSDDKISNLTKQFAVYRYGAVAAEIPAAVVPVKFGA